jgi:hypothetical protein
VTSPLDLDAIEARAKAATQGRWYSDPGIGWPEGLAEAIGIAQTAAGVFWPVRSAIGESIAFVDGRKGTPNAGTGNDAAHIAGLDPQTALALVAEVRRLREAETRMRAALRDIVNGHGFLNNCCDYVDIARAALADAAKTGEAT